MTGLIFKLYDGVHTPLDLADHGGSSFYLGLSSAVAFPPADYYQVHQDETTGMAMATYLVADGDGPREVRCPLWVRGTPDGAQNLAQDIDRWLRQAVRANKNEKKAYPVYLYIARPGSTNATLHRILHGNLDQGSSILSPFTQKEDSTSAKIIGMLNLVLFPTGSTEKPIKLNNVIPGSPDMNRVSATNAIQGWNLINGAEVRTSEQTRSLIGPRCMKLTTATTGHGVETDYGSVPPNWECAGLVHLYVESGTWRVHLVAPSGIVKSVTGISNATQASLATASGGGAVDRSRLPAATWYAFNVQMNSGDVVTDAQMKLRVDCSAAGTIWIDGAQIRTIGPFNQVARPETDIANADGVVPDGWLIDPDYTVAGLDASNYSSTPKAGTVTFDRTISDDTAYIKTVLQGSELVGATWNGVVEVKMINDFGATAKLELRDGAHNAIDSVEFDSSTIASVAEYSRTGDDTATYYGLKVSGVNSLAAGAYLIFYPTSTATGGDFNFIVDEARLVPDPNPTPGDGIPFSQAYISGGNQMINRNDYYEAGLSEPTRFDHFRLFNIPGNRPALVNFRMRLVSATEVARTFLIARYTEEKRPAVDHSLEAENFGAASGSWANVSDSNYSGGSYKRFTAAAPSNLTGYITSPLDNTETLSWNGEWLIFATAEASQVSGSEMYFALDQDWGETVLINEERGTFQAINTKEALFLGRLNLNYSEASVNYARVRNTLRVYATAADTKTIEIDEVFLLPHEEGGWMSIYFPKLYQAETVIVDSVRGEVVRASEGHEAITRGEKRLTCQPGPISSLFIVRWFNAANNSYVHSQSVSTTVEIWPQTTTLLGTK